MASKEILKIAVLGDGLMAKEHTIAWRSARAAFGDLPFEPRLSVIVHPDASRAARAAEQYGVERWTTSWKEAASDPNIDIVDIVTPNAFHRAPAVLAAQSGKHIWCEKPLGLTAADAAAMTEAAELAGVATMVGFTYLQNPGITLARELIDQGELGEIFSFTGFFSADTMVDPEVPFTWRTDRSQAGGGAIGDLGSHMVSIARRMAGPISSAAGLTKTVVPRRKDADGIDHAIDNDNHALALLKFANGAIGSMQASRVQVGRAFEVSFVVTGTTGAIRFSQQESHKLEVSLDSDLLTTHGFRTIELGPGHGPYGALWPMAGINIGLHELKIFEVREFMRAISTGERVLPDFREALEIERTIEAIESSSTHDGAWEVVS